PALRTDETDSGWLRRLRDRRDEADAAGAHADEGTDEGTDDAPLPVDRATLPPVPRSRAVHRDDPDERLDWGGAFHDGSPEDPDEDDQVRAGGWRRTLLVVGLPLLALVLVVAGGYWLGTNVVSAASSTEDSVGSTPTPAAPAGSEAPAEEPASAPLAIASAQVFDPFGDGEPENDDAVPLSYDGDPATSWPTLTYRGSAGFGNLKPGVGVLYDLGSEQALSAVTIGTDTPGATVEVRTGASADGELDSYPVAAEGELTGTDDLAFAEPVTTRYVLVWVTGLVSQDEGFSADLSEVTPVAADAG
ncbi:MAG: hypothetical protein JWQ53_2218, partial [Klenkia sp.]|nr:hypothetical protein [Klenkia sp.]